MTVVETFTFIDYSALPVSERGYLILGAT